MPYVLFIAITYSVCITSLYFNTMNHITLDILHQRSIHGNQNMLIMPNIFFSIIFLMGNIVLTIQNTSPKMLNKFRDNYFSESIFSMLSGLCVSWKSLLNTLSFISLASLFLIGSEKTLFFLSIPIFLLIVFSQTIFFANNDCQNPGNNGSARNDLVSLPLV